MMETVGPVRWNIAGRSADRRLPAFPGSMQDLRPENPGSIG